MTTTKKTYTFEDVATSFAGQAARAVFTRYARWGVTLDDCLSEIHLYLYGKGKRNVDRWLANDPQQTTRINREFYAAAQSFAEKAKAEAVGYDVDDVLWYSPSLVEALMPLALDPTFTGEINIQKHPDEYQPKTKPNHKEGGDLLAMVLDVRRAIDALPEIELDLRTSNPDDSIYQSGLMGVVNYLGGPTPFVGRRRVLSNAEAQAVTRSTYDD